MPAAPCSSRCRFPLSPLVKYEVIYLHEIAIGFTTRLLTGDWIRFYNTHKLYSKLVGKTPTESFIQTQQQQHEYRFKRILVA